MARQCCVKPIAKIIKVGNFEAGITGLEVAFENVYILGIKNEEKIKEELLRLIKEFGNYISRGTENDYKDALYREYQKYIAKKQTNRK